MIALADVKPDPRNARVHSEQQIDQIAASITEFGWTIPFVVDEENLLIAGHGRKLAGDRLGIEAAPYIRLFGLTPAQKKALALADNQLALNASWDESILAETLRELAGDGFELGVIGFDPDWLDSLLNPPEPDPNPGPRTLGALAGEFLIAPFSVLNAREGWWQDRKRKWLELGIQSELGRGDNLIGRSLFERISFIAGNHYQQTRDFVDGLREKGKTDEEILAAAVEKWGEPGKRQSASLKGGVTFKVSTGAYDGRAGKEMDSASGGTSIFDPVLCELAYRWFSPAQGAVLDPFAGGSVRGILAAKLGRHYTGIDLRPEQIEANNAQALAILGGEDGGASWMHGDSFEVLERLAPDHFDFLFSCPPYGDLERYSDDPADLSTMSAKNFAQTYRGIISRACSRLKPDRFACFVVGDYRDEKGFYRNFIGETVRAFEAAGAKLYNHAILITAVGSLPIRAGRTFRSTRKLGTTHQHVLVFCKGDPRRATEACGPVDVSAALEAAGIEATPDPLEGLGGEI